MVLIMTLLVLLVTNWLFSIEESELIKTKDSMALMNIVVVIGAILVLYSLSIEIIQVIDKLTKLS